MLTKKSIKQFLHCYPATFKTIRFVYSIYQSLVVFTLTWLKRIKNLIIPLKHEKFDSGRINVHVGCGDKEHDNFINIDGYPYKNVHYVSNISTLGMFKDESIDLIYASHCLEHFEYNAVPKVLDNWYSKIKPGGYLRLSVPDFALLVDISNQHGVEKILPQLLGGQENKFNYHLSAFDREYLEKLLLATGFVEINTWSHNCDKYATFDDFSIYKKNIDNKEYEISLNIEAKKN